MESRHSFGGKKQKKGTKQTEKKGKRAGKEGAKEEAFFFKKKTVNPNNKQNPNFPYFLAPRAFMAASLPAANAAAKDSSPVVALFLTPIERSRRTQVSGRNAIAVSFRSIASLANRCFCHLLCCD